MLNVEIMSINCSLVCSHLMTPLHLMLILYSQQFHLLVLLVFSAMIRLIQQIHVHCYNVPNRTLSLSKLSCSFCKINLLNILDLLMHIDPHHQCHDIALLDPQLAFMLSHPPKTRNSMWTLCFPKMFHRKKLRVQTTTKIWIFNAPIRCYYH